VVAQPGPGQVKLKAVATARAAAQPIIGFRLMIDGRTLPDEQGKADFGAGKPKAEAEWTVTLPAGSHQFRVLARCPDVSAFSAPVERTNGNLAQQPRLHYVAVGIDKYKVQALELKCAVNDAKAIGNLLTTMPVGPYQPGVPCTLLDAKATKASVTKALESLRGGAVKPNDLVVFFFAGHGFKDASGFYLLTVESNPMNLAKTALSGAELRKNLNNFPCQVLLLLDACHSGAAAKDFRPVVDDVTRTLTEDECGVAVLSAAMAGEKSREKGKHGLFTSAMIDALKKADGVPYNRHNRLQYIHHLHSYVLDEVAHLSDEQQHPCLTLPSIVEPFPIRRVAGK
jgi:hypothetical protein